MQQYYAMDIVTSFIKNLLYNTPLPLVDTVNSHAFMVEGGFYVYKLHLIRCTKSGRMFDGTGEYQIIKQFMPNQDYINLTHRYVSNNSDYDVNTHRFLGDYLRYYRDLYDINLFHYYNCFQPYLVTDLDLGQESPELYKTYITHIKFNTTYTIAIDALTPIYIKPVLYTEIGESELSSRLSIPVSSMRTSYHKPFTYEVPTEDLELYNNRKNLYLAVSVPIGNTSSITIMEGDYTNIDPFHVFNAEDLHQLDPVEMNKILVASPTLLLMNINQSVPFVNRLIENLLHHTINSQETISGNIEMVEKYIDKKSEIFDKYGIWNDNIRYLVYKLRKQLGLPATDEDGWVNKDIEKYIRQGILTYTIGQLVYPGHYKVGYKYDLMQIEDSEHDQYDIEFVPSAILRDLLDIDQDSARKSSVTVSYSSFAGQSDIIIDGYFVANVEEVIVNGNVCNPEYDYTFDTDGTHEYRNIINLNGTYGGRLVDGEVVYEGRLWEQYMGGLSKSSSNNITVTYQYGHDKILQTNRLEITYYE